MTSGVTKAFFVEKLINRKVKRITLGRYPELTPEMAQVSLKGVYEDYLRARKSLKESTKATYEQVLNKAFTSLLDKPIFNISKDHVARQHEKLGQNHGEAYANLAMRILRALFNFAAGQYEDAKGRSLLKWEDVDMKGRTLTIHDTKNNEAHTLPISDFLYDLFLDRQLDRVNEYVFPGAYTWAYIFIHEATFSWSDSSDSSQLAGFWLYTKGPIKF